MISLETTGDAIALGAHPFLSASGWRNPGRVHSDVRVPGDLKDALSEIERSEGVVICLASGTGRRSSGTERERVNFVFVRHPEWYVSVAPQAGARLASDLERWSLRGWDLRDALSLFGESSPAIFECLQSKNVYEEKLSFAPRLRSLLSTFFESNVFFSHYYRELSERVATRSEHRLGFSFLEVVQPLLALLWIERDLGPVPSDTALLAGEVVDEPEVRDALLQLVDCDVRSPSRSASGAELVERYAAREMGRFEFVERERQRFGLEKRGARRDVTGFHPLLDQIFRETVSEAVAFESAPSNRLRLFEGARTAERLARGKRTLLDLIQEYAILCEAKTHHGGQLPPVAEQRWQRMRSFYELLMSQDGESDRPAAVYTAHDIKSKIWSRRALRVRTTETVSVKTDHEALSGRLADVSRGGGLVQCDQALVPGSPIGVSLSLDETADMAELEAEVVWVAGHPAVAQRPRFRMGVRFLDSDPVVDQRLDRLVVQRLERKLRGLSWDSLDQDFVDEERLLVRG